MAGKRRWKWTRRIAKGFLVFLVLLFLLWLFRFPLFGGLIKDEIASALREEGFEIEVGGISGSLVGGVELRDIRVVSGPKIESASIDRIRADYSILGLLTGSENWIGDIEVSGIRAVANLDLPVPPGPPETVEEQPGAPGSVPIPRSIRLDGLDLTVLTGADRLELSGARLHTDRSGAADFTGMFEADRLSLHVDGEEHAAEAPRGTLSFSGGVLSVPDLSVNGRAHENVLRADLAGMDRDVLSLDLHFPLFKGRIDIEAKADLSGEFPDGSATVEIRDLDLRPLLRFAPDLPVAPGRVSATVNVQTPADREPSLESLTGDFRLNIERVEVEGRTVRDIDLRAEISGGRVECKGGIGSPRATLEAALDLLPDEPELEAGLLFRDLDLSELRLDIDGEPILGSIRSLSAESTGPLSSLRFSVVVEGALLRHRTYDAEVVSLRARGVPERIEIDELLVSRKSAVLTAKAVLLPGNPLEFEDATVGLQILDLADLHDLLPGRLPPDLEGQLEIAVFSEVGSTEEPTVRLTVHGADLRGDGHQVRRLAVQAFVPTRTSFDLATLQIEGVDPLPGLEVRDTSIRLVEGGDYPLVAVRGFYLEGFGLSLVNEGDLELDPDGTIQALLIAAQTDGEALRARLPSDVPFSFEFGEGRIALRGAWPRVSADIALSASDLWVVPPGAERVDATAARLAASFSDNRITLSDLSVMGRGWTLAAQGAAPFDPENPAAVEDLPIEAALSLKDVPLALIGATAGLPVETGTLDINAEVSGTPSLPRAVGSVTITGGAVGPPEPGLPRVDGLAAEVRFDVTGSDEIDLRLARLAATALGANLRGEGGRIRRHLGLWAEPALTLSLTGLDLALLDGLLGGPPPAAGRIDVLIEVSPEPSARLTVKGSDLRYESLDPLALELAASWSDGLARVERGSLGDGTRTIILESGQLPLTIDLNPFSVNLPEDGPIAARLTSRIPDIAAVIPESPDLRVTGGVALDLTAGGTIADPTATVVATLEKLRVRSPGAPPVDDLSGEVALRLARAGDGLAQTIEVRDLTGQLGGGPFGVSGSVQARDGVIGDTDLRVTGKNALLVREEGLRLRSDLDLHLRTNSLEDVLIEGEVKVRSLRYTQDVDFVGSGPSPAPLPLTADPFLAKLKLNVAVLMPEDAVRIRTNVLEADIVGRLDVGGTAAVPRPKGRVRILNGELFLPTATMKIPRAAVELRADHPLRPFVDAKATARIAGYDVVADATGPADRMEIDLSASPSLSRSNIVSLLTTGVVWEKVDAKSLQSMAVTVFARQLGSAFGGGDGEESDLTKFINRFEFDVDEMAATFRIEDWLFLRGSQDDPVNFGLDVLFRLAFK